MLTPADVTSAYRLILGREPESSTIVDNFVNHSSFEGLRKTLLSSSEFAERLSRDRNALAMPMVMLTMSAEVQRYKRSVETLSSLGLPIQDMSVLVLGDELAPLADFFLDRRCRVGVAASPYMTRLLEICVATRGSHGANTTILSQDFGEADIAIPASYDFVYGKLPDESSDVMRTWLDNTADACAGSMVLLCKTAPGRSEEVFVTRDTGEAAPMRTIATKQWMVSRLHERFEHVYEPLHVGGYGPLQEETVTGEISAVFIASRQALKLPTLQECKVTSSSASKGLAQRAMTQA